VRCGRPCSGSAGSPLRSSVAATTQGRSISKRRREGYNSTRELELRLAADLRCSRASIRGWISRVKLQGRWIEIWMGIVPTTRASA
jgi:hypothetical protein